jgi:hypothetical protein
VCAQERVAKEDWAADMRAGELDLVVVAHVWEGCGNEPVVVCVIRAGETCGRY